MLDDLIARVAGLDDRSRKQIEQAIVATGVAKMPWLPNPGPQTAAYFHPADILLYGGQGGGGKSDLGIGLAFTAHQRSLILRRKYSNLGSLTERAIKINGSRNGYNGSPPPLLRTDDGRYIQFAGNQHSGDEQDWQGHPFDLKVFDEATQFLELMIRFHLGWIRSTDKAQRTRALLATNPPVTADGDWIVGMFRPWLDLTHPKPAKTGEMRWYITPPDKSDPKKIVDIEVPESDLGLDEQGRRPVQRDGEVLYAKSRTFIPAALKDNPYLVDTNYQAELDALPEPVRSAVRDGNFMAARADADWQVIPTQWIIEAQARWKPDGFKGKRMTAAGLDIGAGRDETVFAPRYDSWYAPLETATGDIARDPSHAAAMVVRSRKDNCPIVVDVGGGFGGPSMMLFKENGIECRAFNGAGVSTRKTRDGKLGFYNKRAEAWWKFREELDPGQVGGSVIALPPDPQVRADLAAPTWEMTTRGIKIEAKEDIKERIGRSPDRGDAVVMALSEGNAAVAAHVNAMRWGSNVPRVITSKTRR